MSNIGLADRYRPSRASGWLLAAALLQRRCGCRSHALLTIDRHVLVAAIRCQPGGFPGRSTATPWHRDAASRRVRRASVRSVARCRVGGDARSALPLCRSMIERCTYPMSCARRCAISTAPRCSPRARCGNSPIRFFPELCPGYDSRTWRLEHESNVRPEPVRRDHDNVFRNRSSDCLDRKGRDAPPSQRQCLSPCRSRRAS